MGIRIFILAFVVLLLGVLDAESQDLRDPDTLHVGMSWNATVFQNPNGPTFALGWNWASEGSKIDSALRINTYHWLDLQSTRIPANILLYEKISHEDNIVNIGYGDTNMTGARPEANVLFNAQAITFEPELRISDTSKGQHFSRQSGSSRGAVFGFENRVAGASGTAADSCRFVLLSDSVTSGSRLVLSKAWNNSTLRYLNTRNKSVALFGLDTTLGHGTNCIDDSFSDQEFGPPPVPDRHFMAFNGKKWYVSINLRSIDVSQLSGSMSDPVITIKLRGSLYDTTTHSRSNRYVVYDSIPTAVNPVTLLDYEGRSSADKRGRYVPLVAVGSTKPDEFVITKAMLVNATPLPGFDNSVTVSALFYATGRNPGLGSVWLDNPFLVEQNYMEKIARKYMDTVDVEVYYHGQVSVAIDYIKIETPRSRSILTGKCDNEIRMAIDRMATGISAMSTTPRLHRFYYMEEFYEEYWNCARYFNYLVNHKAITELDLLKHNSPAHFLEATEFPEYYLGNTFSLGKLNPVPFYRRTATSPVSNGTIHTPSSLNLRYGYDGCTDTQAEMHDWDTTHSAYEMYLNGNVGSDFMNVSVRPNFDSIAVSDYRYHENPPWQPGTKWVTMEGVLWPLELYTYNHFKYNSFLFNSRPWYANVWLGEGNWGRNMTLGSVTLNDRDDVGTRMCTGEEARLFVSYPLVLGAKGLIYWFKTVSGSLLANGSNTIGNGMQLSVSGPYQTFLQNNFGNTEDEFLRLVLADTLGPDWLDPNDATFYNWQNTYDSTRHPLALMGVDGKHLYLGLKSLRYEAYKAHKLISDNETELMNLSLIAWYSKGFKDLYCQHPNSSLIQPTNMQCMISKFIDTSAIKTRPIGRVNSYNEPFYEQSATRDSGFYDITILKDQQTSADDVFYVGVLNRRTDPLFRDATYAGGRMIFVPTAEFDSLIHQNRAYWVNSTVKDSSWWKQKYWQKQGCREIVLPFNYSTHPTGRPRLLRVQEITQTGVTGVDTIISSNFALAIKFQPGEGKVLRVTTLASESEITGLNSLEENGQRKIVSFPTFLGVDNTPAQNPIYDTNLVRYYAVYHRPDFDQNGVPLNKRRVYFRRSTLVNKQNMSATLVSGLSWGPEVLVSDSLKDQANSYVDLDCAYPSLVVRFDTALQRKRVYIVYTCKGTGPIQDVTNIRTDWICESIFEADTAGRKLPRVIEVINTVVDPYGADPIDTYGHPVINSHADGQYICFSDQARGIVAGWQPATIDTADFSLSFTKSIAWRPSSYNYNLTYHPSVNSYSNLWAGERECALVWDEHHWELVEGSGGGPPMVRPSHDVFYTRLSHSSSALNNYLDKPLKISPGSFSIVNSDTSILEVSDYEWYLIPPNTLVPRYGNHEKAVVYSTLLPKIWRKHVGDTSVVDMSDIIHWEVPVVGLKSLFSVSVSRPSRIETNQTIGSVVNSKHEFSVGSLASFSLSDASSTAGTYNLVQLPYGVGSSLYYNHSLDHVRVSMTQKSSPVDTTVLTREIMHGQFDINAFRGLDLSIKDAKNSHLSAHYLWNDSSQFTNNRRLFQRAEVFPNQSIYSHIASSAWGLMKSSVLSDAARNVSMAGYNNGKSFYVVSPVEFDDGEVFEFIDINAPRRLTKHDHIDTLATDWFKVGNQKHFSMLQTGGMKDRVSLVLQKRATGRSALLDIVLSSSEQSKYRKQVGSFVNGNDDEYRFLLLNRDPKGKLEHHHIFDCVEDRAYGKRAEDEEDARIDLSTLYDRSDMTNALLLFPNPVSGRVSISVGELALSDIEVCRVLLVNELGITKQLPLKGGRISESYDLSELTSGMYLLSIEYQKASGEIERLSRSFIKY